MDTPGAAYGVAVAGDAGVRVIDISVPTTPLEVGFLDTDGTSDDILVVGERAYVADRSNGLLVLDISTPSGPTEIGAFDTIGKSEGLSLAGGIVVVADSNAGLAVFDDCREVIFDDGFEALGTSAWSSIQP